MTHTAQSPIEAVIHKELLAARKSREGLSPNSMANYKAMRDLLGNGDPYLAFTRLQHRILETLELDDDVIPMTAAAYSLGLGSASKTHLDRLNDFGTEYGFEARQSRRHSDTGIRQLARLITSNWVVHSIPTVDVYLVEQSNGSFAIMMQTSQLAYIDMRELSFSLVGADGEQKPVPLEVDEERKPSGEHEFTVERVIKTLKKPFMLKAPHRDKQRTWRMQWPGELWPCFTVTTIGALSKETTVSSQTLGNSLVITIAKLPEPSTVADT